MKRRMGELSWFHRLKGGKPPCFVPKNLEIQEEGGTPGIVQVAPFAFAKDRSLRSCWTMTKPAALERKADALLPVGGWEGAAVDAT